MEESRQFGMIVQKKFILEREIYYRLLLFVKFIIFFCKLIYKIYYYYLLLNLLN